MKTIKEKIEKYSAEKFKGSCSYTEECCFADGAEFAIKAVIEMLEERKNTFSKQRSKSFDQDTKVSLGCKIRAINEIINLLKSEA